MHYVPDYNTIVWSFTGNFIDLNPKSQSLSAKPMVHEGQEYSVFCLHHVPGTWDHVRVKELIGDRDGDAKYFSIVRDPVDLFISMWDYYDFSGTLKMDLETFAMKF